MALHFKRSTLVVADIERSLSIYRDILGFTVNYIKESSDDSYSYPVFNIPKHAKIKFGALDSPDQQRTLGFTEVKGVTLDKPKSIFMSACVIQVEGLESVMEKIIALGLKHTEIETDTTSDGKTFKEQSFVDFDGHLIVIYELTE